MKKDNQSGKVLKVLILIILLILIYIAIKFFINFVIEYKDDIPSAKSTISIVNLKDDEYIEQQNQDVSIPKVEITNQTYNNNQESTNIAKNFYYTQIDDYAKVIYNYLENNKNELKSGIYRIDFGKEFDELLHEPNGKEELSNSFQAAISAFMYDNVDIFYIEVSKMSFEIISTTRGTNTSYTTYLQNTEGQIYLSNGFNKKNVEKAISEVENIKKLIIDSVEGMNDYEKVKQVHDILINSYTYDSTLQAENTHDIYGALIKNVCVCDGYAKSLKYILDELNIPCIVVMGTATDQNGTTENHAWNYIYLNNNWYGIDVTWDDPIINGSNTETTPNKYRYDYFLKGEEVFKNTSYVELTKFPNANTLISYPELSKTNYK